MQVCRECIDKFRSTVSIDFSIQSHLLTLGDCEKGVCLTLLKGFWGLVFALVGVQLAHAESDHCARSLTNATVAVQIAELPRDNETFHFLRIAQLQLTSANQADFQRLSGAPIQMMVDARVEVDNVLLPVIQNQSGHVERVSPELVEVPIWLGNTWGVDRFRMDADYLLKFLGFFTTSRPRVAPLIQRHESQILMRRQITLMPKQADKDWMIHLVITPYHNIIGNRGVLLAIASARGTTFTLLHKGRRGSATARDLPAHRIAHNWNGQIQTLQLAPVEQDLLIFQIPVDVQPAATPQSSQIEFSEFDGQVFKRAFDQPISVDRMRLVPHSGQQILVTEADALARRLADMRDLTNLQMEK